MKETVTKVVQTEELMPQITTISLHIGQMILGNMCTSFDINSKKVGKGNEGQLAMYLTPVGVDVVLKGRLVKTIPYSNIQGIDYAND